jgi:hypothetical protein
MQNIRKIKTYQDAVSYLPADLKELIVGSFIASLGKSHVIHRNKHPPMITVETELFKQLAFIDRNFPST